MRYKNPITLKKDNQRQNAGDPFVLKFDGLYYLYTSTEADDLGIRCYTSKDLVNWNYQKIVVNDPVTKNAYAPEVIFFKDKFILATSPSGKGHYLFVADHPLGPFKRVTENIGHMIDGSFYKEKGKLYFLRANHLGITIHEVTDDFKLINRVDLAAEMHGWTEGPFLIKRKGVYYLTYCGNNLFADTYRVDYSYSNNIFGPYVKGENNSLINKLNSNYNYLGHSSFIKGPDLDTYYNVYHKLSFTDTSTVRDYCMDRVDFNGDTLKQNVTDRIQKYPNRPTFESYKEEHDNQFKIDEDYYVSKKQLDFEYILEANYQGNDICLHFGETYMIANYHEGLGVFRNHKLIKTLDVRLSNQCINKIELRQSETLEVYINDNLIDSLDIQTKGYVKIPKEYMKLISYIAFNNYVYKNVNGIQTLPNLVFSDQDFLNEGLSISADIEGNSNYLLSAYLKVVEDLTFEIQGKQVTIDKNDSHYEFNKEVLTILKVDGNMNLTIKILQGKGYLKYLEFEDIDQEELDINQKDRLLKETINVSNQDIVNNTFSTKLKILDKQFNSRFGLLVNVTEFSEYTYQARYPFNGYFIGFYQNLLVVDRVNFGIKRIYDVPVELKGDTHTLKAKIKRNKIYVYIDNELIIECYDNHIKHTGYLGTYSNELSNIEFLDTKGGTLND